MLNLLLLFTVVLNVLCVSVKSLHGFGERTACDRLARQHQDPLEVSSMNYSEVSKDG